MRLVELTGVPEAALPVARLRDHLRLGRGFGPDAEMDALLVELLRAALVAVERRTGKALILQDFLWEVTHWRDRGSQPLPVAPVQAVTAMVVRRASGPVETVDPGRYRLVQDSYRPRLDGWPVLPVLSGGDVADVTLQAGYAAQFDALPADLGHAVIALAAHLYDSRGRGLEDFVPSQVLAALAPYRSVRLFGGRE